MNHIRNILISVSVAGFFAACGGVTAEQGLGTPGKGETGQFEGCLGAKCYNTEGIYTDALFVDFEQKTDGPGAVIALADMNHQEATSRVGIGHLPFKVDAGYIPFSSNQSSFGIWVAAATVGSLSPADYELTCLKFYDSSVMKSDYVGFKVNLQAAMQGLTVDASAERQDKPGFFRLLQSPEYGLSGTYKCIATPIRGEIWGDAKHGDARVLIAAIVFENVVEAAEIAERSSVSVTSQSMMQQNLNSQAQGFVQQVTTDPIQQQVDWQQAPSCQVNINQSFSQSCR